MRLTITKLNMKNETKAEKIIRKEIEQYSILKPTSMAKDIIKALKEANLISSNLPVMLSLPLSSITDKDAIGAAKIIFPAMEWEVKRYGSHIYYLDVIQKTKLKSKWRLNIFWLANDIKLWHDMKGEESVERGGKIIFDAYRYLESKGYNLNGNGA